MDLRTPLASLPGVGLAVAKKLARLNLVTVEDLIRHYPFRYDDFSEQKSISTAKVGEIVTFCGQIWSIKNAYTKFRKVLTQAILNDSTGTIEIVWFNQPWLAKNLAPGDKIQVSGKVNRKGPRITLVSPVWEKTSFEDNFSDQGLHTGRLVPIYPETWGLTSKWLRQKISNLLPKALPLITDPLPSTVTKNLLPLHQALKQIHFPQNHHQAQEAKKRLSFDELFYIQLNALYQKQQWQNKGVVEPLKIEEGKIKEFLQKLPFQLTSAQERVIQEILQDLQKGFPMNRLLQGEVGSGKTVVAAAIIYSIYLNKLKSVVMAPTEILAFQHHQTLSKLLNPYGVEVGIYTGSKKSIAPHLIVGTHALLSNKLITDNVGLVVIDEQQRFGVEQRSLLRHKTCSPHFLTMTATPIPRTVALTLYGDLDLSIIDEMPPGRKIVRTHFVPKGKRADSYKFIESEVKKGHQVYIITPLIEPSETNGSAKAARVEFERLQKNTFPDLKLGLLHGKLKSREKEAAISDFKNGKTQILVSTSVVEVGVDVPRATIMVIEGAEHFGLAQLHQLRGRVGRGDEQSFTFLFAEEETPSVVRRLKNLETIHQGLALAELDLKIRGSGEIFGTMQSGRWNLKIASFNDLSLIESARSTAQKFLLSSSNLDKHPHITSKLLGQAAKIMPD